MVWSVGWLVGRSVGWPLGFFFRKYIMCSFFEFRKEKHHPVICRAEKYPKLFPFFDLNLFCGLRISTLQVEPKEIPLAKGSWEDHDFRHVIGMGYVILSISRKVLHGNSVLNISYC